jgi:hypothetical protein
MNAQRIFLCYMIATWWLIISFSVLTVVTSDSFFLINRFKLMSFRLMKTCVVDRASLYNLRVNNCLKQWILRQDDGSIWSSFALISEMLKTSVFCFNRTFPHTIFVRIYSCIVSPTCDHWQTDRHHASKQRLHYLRHVAKINLAKLTTFSITNYKHGKILHF